jgi:hypothetical protein
VAQEEEIQEQEVEEAVDLNHVNNSSSGALFQDAVDPYLVGLDASEEGREEMYPQCEPREHSAPHLLPPDMDIVSLGNYSEA